jgi:hypothetical protein
VQPGDKAVSLIVIKNRPKTLEYFGDYSENKQISKDNYVQIMNCKQAKRGI